MLSTYQRQRRRQNSSDLEGFTMIEILIVIVVLGILAAVVIFALGGIAGKSAVAACQADGSTVSSALSAYNTLNAGTGQATPTQALLLSGTPASGSPYLQSWPSNSPHYAFAMTNDGQLAIEVPATAGWAATVNSAPASALAGTITGGELYSGPSTCTSAT